MNAWAKSVVGKLAAAKWLAGGLLLATILGCGNGVSYPTTAPIKGIVSYNNQPLADANISFIPDEGRPATATTNAQGEFELSTFRPGDGAVLGEHRVIVEKTLPPTSGDLYAEGKAAVPKVYSAIKSTPLRHQVTAEGDTAVRIELKD